MKRVGRRHAMPCAFDVFLTTAPVHADLAAAADPAGQQPTDESTEVVPDPGTTRTR